MIYLPFYGHAEAETPGQLSLVSSKAETEAECLFSWGNFHILGPKLEEVSWLSQQLMHAFVAYPTHTETHVYVYVHNRQYNIHMHAHLQMYVYTWKSGCPRHQEVAPWSAWVIPRPQELDALGFLGDETGPALSMSLGRACPVVSAHFFTQVR